MSTAHDPQLGAPSSVEPKPTKDDPRQVAAEVLRAEAAAVASVVDQLDDHFDRAVELVLACSGSVIVSGIGKSGWVGQKISATMSSIGTPSHFVHATEAAHGDLGRIRTGDVVLLLSFSGQTEEVVSLAALLSAQNIPMIGITGDRTSLLARQATAPLCVGRLTEVCPHNLAPTSSTTAMMALGDALAMAVSRSRAFSADEFRKRHPGGLLGKRLLPVTSIMRRPGASLVLLEDRGTLGQVMVQGETGGRRAGAILLVDEDGRLSGILTDADFRRSIVTGGLGVLERPIREIMTTQPRCLRTDQLVGDAIELVRKHRLDEIPVVDEAGCPVGLVDVQDLVSMRLVEEENR